MKSEGGTEHFDACEDENESNAVFDIFKALLNVLNNEEELAQTKNSKDV